MKKKIAVFANEKISAYLLNELYKKNIKVDLIFTSSFKNKKKISDWVDLKRFSKKIGKPKIIEVNSPKSNIVKKKLKSLKPDYIFVMSWSQIISKEILNIPKKGTISFHYSNLPKRRGGAPLFWTIFDNLKYMGITIYYMTNGIDDGDIIDSMKIKLSKNENVKSLLEKIYEKFPLFYVKIIKNVFLNKVKIKKQNNKIATYTKARKPSQGLISFSMKSSKLIKFVNALTEPYPCAFFNATDLNGKNKKFKIIETVYRNNKLLMKGYIE